MGWVFCFLHPVYPGFSCLILTFSQLKTSMNVFVIIFSTITLFVLDLQLRQRLSEQKKLQVSDNRGKFGNKLPLFHCCLNSAADSSTGFVHFSLDLRMQNSQICEIIPRVWGEKKPRSPLVTKVVFICTAVTMWSQIYVPVSFLVATFPRLGYLRLSHVNEWSQIEPVWQTRSSAKSCWSVCRAHVILNLSTTFEVWNRHHIRSMGLCPTPLMTDHPAVVSSAGVLRKMTRWEGSNWPVLPSVSAEAFSPWGVQHWTMPMGISRRSN